MMDLDDSIECISTSDLDDSCISSQFSSSKPYNNISPSGIHPTTSVHELLECPVCTNSMYPPIHQVYAEDEWSFGYCEQGTGVFSCPFGKNPMYTYRECIVLGRTNFSIFKINQILRELSREWAGHSYDLLSKNCNHFCDEFCERLGVPKLPGWVNRFANAGDTAVEIAGNTAFRLRQAKTEIVSASKVAYRFLLGVNSNSAAASSESLVSNRGSPRFQTAWFKSLVSVGPRPSGSSELEGQDEDVLLQQRRHDAEAPQGQRV